MSFHLRLCFILAAAAAAAFAPAAAAQEAASLDFSLRSGPRQLAPGVLKVIPVDPRVEETFSGPRPLVEINKGFTGIDWTPHYSPSTQTLLDMSQKVIFRRPIWNLELSFKPVRMIHVNVPQPNGVMQRKLIWYMVYRVVNRGGHLQPVPKADVYDFETYEVNRVDQLSQPIRFYPHFVLRSHEDIKSEEEEYLDRPIPIAVRAIQNREDPYTHLYSSAEISQFNIPLSTPGDEKPVWGVAMWEDVDPRIDHFSVYVRGLTNAYRFADDQDFPTGGKPTQGRLYTYKTLQLNYWRPGDEFSETEEEIRYGVPVFPEEAENERMLSLYSLENRVDHTWIYR